MLFRCSLMSLIVFCVVGVSWPVNAQGAGPEGLWLVKDRTARIRIEKCGNEMWGIVAWQDEPKRDVNNPDPAMHNRSLLGSVVLIGMRPAAANLWEGDIYNARDGKTYSSKMAMLPSGALEIKGCVLGGMICGGESWTRLPEPPAVAGAASKNICATLRRPAGR
jgi:uncharacterized protein (DUF2147 family)